MVQMHIQILITSLIFSSISLHRCFAICSDSKVKFNVTKVDSDGVERTKRKSCDWVKRNNKRSRCKNIPGVKEACPLTCTNCCVDSEEPFNLKWNKKIRSCSWARAGDTVKRCGKFPTNFNCPVTCGLCGDHGLVQPPSPSSPDPETEPVICPNNKSFNITLMNMGTNTNYDSAFQAAKTRWESIIKCDLPDIPSREENPSFDWFVGQFHPKRYSGPVDDIVIGYAVKYIDGPKKLLGYAGSAYFRNGNTSPASGRMVFDEADFDVKNKNDVEIIILHEMGHVLGLVNSHQSKCYSSCAKGKPNFDYGWDSGCTKASEEYNKLGLGLGVLKVENDGGFGTSCAHWEDANFPPSMGSSEFMTGFFRTNFPQSISRVTIAALEEGFDDYVVDYSAADPYPMPSNITFVESKRESNIYFPETTFTIFDKMVELSEPIELD